MAASTIAVAESAAAGEQPPASASRLRTYLDLVRFSHTIFALPFAAVATLIAIRFGGDGRWSTAEPWSLVGPLAGILACMVAARTAAMAFNRLVDRAIDADNPRTAGRHLPRGAVGTGEVLGLVVVSAAAFVAATLLFLPNWLPLTLSLPVLAWLLGYSFAKRFTSLSHVWLGAALGLAPVAAWIALRGETLLRDPVDALPAAILGLAVTAWVAGFDIIYACQDAAFDAARGLHSVPARLGVPRALNRAQRLHVVTLLVLATLPAVVPQLGWIYWAALAAIAALLAWEHAIVRPNDLSRVNQAFFSANAAIGLVLLAAIAADLWI
ncbi:MAG: 4-hydroxybenzoate octaprenyltransferase [Planctomycetes bacterium]|nr:4-hydroxybenzoate octaprenyltransferase [Planctomycetota bacterium]MBM4057568.1 4-hydroxybenzoate octaprenyltransferase [Planctomycetota bacterium]